MTTLQNMVFNNFSGLAVQIAARLMVIFSVIEELGLTKKVGKKKFANSWLHLEE